MPTAAAIDVSPSQRPAFMRRLQEMLGVGRLRSDRDLVALVERRLPTRALEALRRYGLSGDEIHTPVLPRPRSRTGAREAKR